jgi:hypothetical protein
MQPGRRRVSARGLGRAFLRLLGAALVLVVAYFGLARAGIVPNPFAPATRGDIDLAESDRPGLRVLFVGNSFTRANSLPQLVHELAAADDGAQPIFAVERTRGGWTLHQASEDGGLRDLLERIDWDVVVLQEQSQLLSVSAGQWGDETYPYADRLRRMILASGAKPLLFMTWGYQRGDRQNVDNDSFDAMQSRLDVGYSHLGRLLEVPVAPVGVAWGVALHERPALDLWSRDGRHPSEAGSYLAACVLYAAVSGRDPTRSGFLDEIEPSEARFFQRVAARVAG